MLEELFVYGTLKDKGIQKEILGKVIEDSRIDFLEGYSITEIKIDDNVYPVVVPNKNFSVAGLVLSITNEELKLLDEYESEGYKREKVNLFSGKICWAYIKKSN